jgi:RNA polymerase sigma factor (sigma-70 family)
MNFIRANNTSPEADEDLLQDTLVTTYLEVERGHYTPRPGVPFTAYVKGIARNKIREARRRQRRWEPLDENAPPLADPPRPLEASYESDEERRALWQGLQHLPTSRRQVLEHYLGGQSLTEIAATLRMNEALVRQHKHRGLRILQRTLLG